MQMVNVHHEIERESPSINIVWSYWIKRRTLLEKINIRVMKGEITKAEAYDLYLNWRDRKKVIYNGIKKENSND